MSSISASVSKNIIDYNIGDKAQCYWPLHKAYERVDIIEKRRLQSDSNTSVAFKYYIHYDGYDRRLDEWVTIDRLKPRDPSDKPPESFDLNDDGKVLTRRESKRKIDAIAASSSHHRSSSHHHEETDPSLAAFEAEHEEITKVKNIACIEMGRYEIDTWYYSPYPEEYCVDNKLYLCEFCLKYMRKRSTSRRHKGKCPWRHPPGNEIYRKENLSIFEVDGKTNKIYCQNLCLLAKLFLDHKTLYYDVEPFLFYIVCEVDDMGHHAIGYFSKEKESAEEFNLACILTFPPYQRKGYGKFLISISYELSKREKKVGSPEKPLSDLGKLSYRSYWTYSLMTLLQKYKQSMSIKEMGKLTGIKSDDIISTLHSLNFIKYWKGQHIISITAKAIEEHLRTFRRPMVLCDPVYLKWDCPGVSSSNSKKKQKI